MSRTQKLKPAAGARLRHFWLANWAAICTGASWGLAGLFGTAGAIAGLASGNSKSAGLGGETVFAVAWTAGAISWGYFLHWLRTRHEMTSEVRDMQRKILAKMEQCDGPPLSVVRDQPSR